MQLRFEDLYQGAHIYRCLGVFDMPTRESRMSSNANERRRSWILHTLNVQRDQYFYGPYYPGLYPVPVVGLI